MGAPSDRKDEIPKWLKNLTKTRQFTTDLEKKYYPKMLDALKERPKE